MMSNRLKESYPFHVQGERNLPVLIHNVIS